MASAPETGLTKDCTSGVAGITFLFNPAVRRLPTVWMFHHLFYLFPTCLPAYLPHLALPWRGGNVSCSLPAACLPPATALPPVHHRGLVGRTRKRNAAYARQACAAVAAHRAARLITRITTTFALDATTSRIAHIASRSWRRSLKTRTRITALSRATTRARHLIQIDAPRDIYRINVMARHIMTRHAGAHAANLCGGSIIRVNISS